MIAETGRIRGRFHGGRSGSGPLTFGQQYIWNAIVRTSPNDAHLNGCRILDVTPARTVEEIVDALSHLVLANEGLRTRFVRDDAGTPAQVVKGSGHFDVELVECGGEDITEVTERVRRRLLGARFDLDRDWPFRVAIVCQAGMPRDVVVVVSHIAADKTSLGLLLSQWKHVLGSVSATLSAGRQPLEQAEYERLVIDRERQDRLVRRWRDMFALWPNRLLTGEREAARPRYREGILISEAAGAALSTLQSRLGVSTQSIALAAVSLLVGKLTSRSFCPISVLSSNRHTPEVRHSFMNLPQRSPTTDRR